MKANIHPTYYPTAKVTCSCGVTFEVGATVESIHVEVCSACHPFYTGKQNLVDTAGRVDKFKQRTEKAEALKAKQAARSSAKASDGKQEGKTDQTSTDKLKDMRKSLLANKE